MPKHKQCVTFAEPTNVKWHSAPFTPCPPGVQELTPSGRSEVYKSMGSAQSCLAHSCEAKSSPDSGKPIAQHKQKVMHVQESLVEYQ
eukprot:5449800-Amphidinium_carterae.1